MYDKLSIDLLIDYSLMWYRSSYYSILNRTTDSDPQSFQVYIITITKTLIITTNKNSVSS